MCRGITCIVLTVVNAVLLAGGLAMLIFGALLKYNKAMLQKIIETALTKAGGNLDGIQKEQMDLALERIEEMAGPIGNFLFIFGIVLCCVAGVAFIGLCCNIKLLMIIYSIVIGAIFVAHLLIIIIYFAKRDVLMQYVEKGFMDMVKQYTSLESKSPESIAALMIMPSLQCCGYNNGNDFTGLSTTDNYNGFQFTGIKHPIPCCDLTKFSPELIAQQKSCPWTTENSFVEVGCKSKIEVLIDKVMKYSIIVLLIEAAVLAVVILHICCGH